MKIVHLSYAHMREHHNPEVWLKKINFFVLLLERMAGKTDVKSIHCLSYSGVLEKNKVEYHFLSLRLYQVLLPLRLNSYVRSLQADVVIVHGFQFPLKTLLLRWRLGSKTKIIIQHHAERPMRHYKSVLQRLLDKLVSAYFFTARDQADAWLSERQIVDPNKIYEVMEVPSVFCPIDKIGARLKTNANNFNKNYLWVGRLDANKDPLTLIKAFTQFITGNFNVHLYVVFQSNELIEEVIKLISTEKAKMQITLVGKVEHDELLYWYNSVDFIISTSHYEGSGIAVCEGMSCGAIPILTNIPSFRMMTGNGSCGLLFEKGSVDGLVTTLQASLEMDVEIARAETLSQYNKHLSAEAIANKMIDVCSHIMRAGN